MKGFILKHRAVCVLLIFVTVCILFCSFIFIGGSRYSIYVNFPQSNECKNVEVFFGKGSERTTSDIFTVTKTKIRDRYAKVTISAKNKGAENVSIKVHTVSSEGKSDFFYLEKVRSGINNTIYNNVKKYFYVALAAFSLLVCIQYFALFMFHLKNDRFSYNSIFFLSVSIILLLMLAVWCGAFGYSMVNFHMPTSETLHTINENLTIFIIAITLPLVFLFSVSVSVSNIQLMRKEGFRPANGLGIAVSIVMMLGLAVVAVLVYLNGTTQSVLYEIIYAVVSSLYVVFEVILICTVFCGIYVSKSRVSYDKDYVIILGCAIKKDGTLYPLLRGRADGAVDFYFNQLKATGKKAFLVPSGGQGSDEIMSEAQAIKNYLLERGIPEEQIIPEMKSTTTLENMRFSKEIIDRRQKDAKTAFSTTSYHVFRSGIIASTAGLKADGIGNKTKWYFWPNAFLREVAGLFVSQPKKQLMIIFLIALFAGIGSYLYTLI
ncbi:MAG: YdcF family protein [Ruminococcus sp.]|nr:YdcF family protein [Candidatus Copronaster equi]